MKIPAVYSRSFAIQEQQPPFLPFDHKSPKTNVFSLNCQASATQDEWRLHGLCDIDGLQGSTP